LLPIACLCLAALVAFATARFRSRFVASIAIVLVLADLHASVYHKSAPGNPDAIASRGDGRLLELPVLDPSVHLGSVYLWYDMADRRERPGGYSTTAPKAAKRTADQLERLNCGDWSGGISAQLAKLDVTRITLHRGLFTRNRGIPDTTAFALRGPARHGWRATRSAGSVSLFERGIGVSEPDLAAGPPVFCQGWYGDTGSGRYMSERHAPFWIYGGGRLRLVFAASTLPHRVTVDGRRGLRLRGRGWHLVTVDVARLVSVAGQKRRVGLKLIRVEMETPASVTYPSSGS